MPESKRVSRTDWAKVDATTDEDISRQIAVDPDAAPELTDEDFDRAEVWDGNTFLGHGRDFKNGRKIGRPKGSGTKEMVTLRLDHAVLDHFRADGPGWQTRLNDTLRAAISASAGSGVVELSGSVVVEDAGNQQIEVLEGSALDAEGNAVAVTFTTVISSNNETPTETLAGAPVPRRRRAAKSD